MKEQVMVISVMDQDRPGIVAEITEAIGCLGGNLTDLRESVLSGWFTMILSASFSADLTAESVEKALTDATSSKVSVALHNGETDRAKTSDLKYILTAVAEDRIGLVAAVSRFCCDRNVNILDLASHVEGDQYTMILMLDLANIENIRSFRDELENFSKTSGLKLVLQHSDIFRATNEI